MSFNFQETQDTVKQFWEKNKIREKVKAKGKGKEQFYFLDGPPYTSGKVHIGTAWNKSLKDEIIRYKRMRGFDVWDRAGYDMHGLPIEHKVQEKHGIKHKDDIPGFGIAKFIEECRKFSVDNMKSMNKDFEDLGVWMDFENAYMPITEQSIESIWWLIKKVHEQGRLYKGKRPMTWCPTCASALAKHELEYEDITDTSIYVKFPLANDPKQFLVIWTTTPWTIPFNQFIMVNPDEEYVKAQVNDEVWIVAKELADHVIKDVAEQDYTINETVKGNALKGTQYTHIYHELLPQYQAMKDDNKKMFTVIPSAEYVDLSAGSGLVHAASGTGVGADYEVAHANGISSWSELDDNGHFEQTMGPFAGMRAKFQDEQLVEKYTEDGHLAGIEKYKHDYPHCWRCHNKAIFKTTEQWFFKVEDLKEKMLAENKKISWVPQAGFNAFDSWLSNLRDNSITKQRFWGTPLPVWHCDSCEEYDVLATRKEIEEKSGVKPRDLHKPWIDEATYSCACGGTKTRIPDVMDVWIDPGCASWYGLEYPTEEQRFKALFPADFILEGIDQYRGWFNVLMVCSMLAFGKRSFNACYVHGFVNDTHGRKMSKSQGNYILPQEVTEKYGADATRYYMIGAANPAIDMKYNFEDLETKFKHLLVFWNMHKYILDLGPGKTSEPGFEEQYILSRMHSTIKTATEAMDNYKLNELPGIVEQFLLDLSRTYIQLVREKTDKELVAATLATTYKAGLLLFAPVAPFFTEHVYQQLKEPLGWEEESIHLCGWPTFDQKSINEQLEQDVALAKDTIAAILEARDRARLGVRWPVQTVHITCSTEQEQAITRMQDLINVQTNVKELSFEHVQPNYDIKPNAKALGKEFGEKTGDVIGLIKKHTADITKMLNEEGESISIDGITLTQQHLNITIEAPEPYTLGTGANMTVYLDTTRTEALDQEGFAREVTRRIQQLRKKAGLVKADRITLEVVASEAIKTAITTHKADIMEKTGVTKLTFVEKITHEQKDETTIKGERLSIGF
ncbi:MAG: isoleucine--tRNA ligase [Candidatus Woesearchaeota archaeon]|nr:isoleucine--tRNA ligase [Candidatus Woesearchaeota archaeon]